ncbi:hypothetical protein Golob_015019 [Gossypium lobatum]|uniref:Uncharacterized protein n=1 Tax=Gossypium lobatum TaxID=34289 RepID=A0A7J8LZT1_9ROSI|nr:hypothetical protein [Gossypium lobatum]
MISVEAVGCVCLSMENGIAGLRINDDDEEVLQVAGVSEGQNRMYDLCLVGGIEISNLVEKRIDIRSPLKRRKKIQLSPQNHTYGSVVGSVGNSLESRGVRVARGFLVSKGMSNINTVLGINLEGRLKEGIRSVASSSTGFG